VTPQILTTKLFIPSPEPNRVSRQRLLAQLQSWSTSKLTLISAPAGYGKTSLLSEWINQREIPFGWISLDQHDNDLKRFLAYIIASLQSIDIELGEPILNLYQSHQSDPPTTILIPLINQIAASDRRFALVLDDYHLIQSQEIHEALIYLLDNLPQKMHLVISTRIDPPFRLSQLRARGELCEIRSQDLRFTIEEAVRFLNHSMKLGLSPSDVITLTGKTEGWIAGLQLAAISLQKHPDKHNFVTAFAGDDRYIADYLLDEALHHQAPHIQTFLLQTSILDRLCVPLCDAVTSKNDSQVILSEIERANLFLVPMDNQRNWYRYHHLFANLLNKRLQQTQPREIPDLQLKASIWYEKNGLLPDALNHALATNDVERIAQLTEEMAVDKMDYGELNVFLAWLDHLPEITFLQHPWLLVARTWVLFNTGKYEAVEVNLVEIEQILVKEGFSKDLVRRIQGHVAAIRCYLAELREDAASAMRQAEDSLALLPDKDIKLRSFVAIRWANCLAWYCDFDKAITAYEQVGEAGKLVGDGHLAITALSEMAAVQMVSGKLHQAVETITDIKNYAEMLAQKDGRRLPAMGGLYRHLSHIKHERNELSESGYYAREAVNICQQWGEKEALIFSLFSLVRSQVAQGEYEKANQTLSQVMQIASQISPFALEKFRIYSLYYKLRQGKIEEAEIWSRDLEFPIDVPFSADVLFAYANLSRVLIAKGRYSQALKIITALLKWVIDVGASFYTIRFNVMRAEILQNLNRPDDAMKAMEDALSLASPQGYVRSFLDEGEPAAQLLYLAAQKGIYPEYCLKLLDEYSKQIPTMYYAPDATGGLVEPLSDREIEVLINISQGLTNQAIAQQLVLSLHTVKSHARNIYSKLGVKNRTEAIARARLLGLLTQD